MKKVWYRQGGDFHLDYPAHVVSELDNEIYVVRFDQNMGRFYLESVAKEYNFDYKLYGLETKLINRIIRTYENKDANLGVLLNGVKGTGKTVTCKQIANTANQPTILIDSSFGDLDVAAYVNSIPQNITVFVDEYEKVFSKSNKLLTIMDGATASDYRRLFLFTTNELRVEENLLQRPSRVRYLKEFGDLSNEVIEEIIDDLLIHKNLKLDCMAFIAQLSIITVDIVKQIVEEVNIHNESPDEFGDIFNVSKVKAKHNIYEMRGDDEIKIASNVRFDPRRINQNSIGNTCYINDIYIGDITNIFSNEMIEVTQKNSHTNKTNVIKIRIEESFGYHSNYAYGDNGIKTKNTNTDRFDELIGFYDVRIREEEMIEEKEVSSYSIVKKVEPPF